MLLDRLHGSDVSSPSYNVLKNYNSHGKQIIRIGDQNGTTAGNDVWPILFLIYISSMSFVNGFGGHLISLTDVQHFFSRVIIRWRLLIDQKRC